MQVMDPPRTDRPARHSRWWIVPVAVFVVLALVATGLFIARYDPLTAGSTVMGGTDFVRDATAHEGEVTRHYLLTPGDTISISIWLANDGPLGVTVLSVPTMSLLEPVVLSAGGLADLHHPTDPSFATPFHSFSVHRGTNPGILLLLRMRTCQDLGPGASLLLYGFDVRYRVLGINRTQFVAFPEDIAMDVPATGCPKP